MFDRAKCSLILFVIIVTHLAGVPASGITAGDPCHSCSRGGMVVTACPIATLVGRDILLRGGNAVDAAVAVGFALAVTYPAAGNIGGGGFILVRLNSGETGFIDFREKAPIRASRDMYLDDKGRVLPGSSTLGHKAAGVPGSVAGLHMAHTLYGSMSWREVLDPAISLATDGFPVSGNLSESLEGLQKYIERFPGLKKFSGRGGVPLEEGDTLRQPELAQALRRIAENGPDEFYLEETSDLILEEMKRGGGLITKEDLAQYRAVLREPITGEYRGYEIISAPPPSSGGTILMEILNIVEGFDMENLRFPTEEAVHLIAESEKLAYLDRSRYLGDPDFIDIPLSSLISKGYAKHLRSFIRNKATPASVLDTTVVMWHEGEETTHYSILDTHGNAVAATTTLNGGFGSKVVVRGAGFLLNNEMDDFSVKPGIANMYGLIGGKANAIAPEKRMLSSMTPTIVLKDGKLFLILGTPGGSTIITTVAQILMNIIDFGMALEDAVSAPRFHHQWIPDRIDFEKGAFSSELIEKLRERGHVLNERSSNIGDVQVILVGDSLICGASDPRGGGRACGIDSIVLRW